MKMKICLVIEKDLENNFEFFLDNLNSSQAKKEIMSKLKNIPLESLLENAEWKIKMSRRKKPNLLQLPLF